MLVVVAGCGGVVKRGIVMRKEKPPVAWFSHVLRDSTLLKSFTSELDLQTAGRLGEKMQTGVPVRQEDCPEMIFWRYPNDKVKSVPDLFLGGLGLVVSQAVADVMRDFELGQTQLFPVSVRRHDRVTPGARHPLLAGHWRAKRGLVC